MLGSIYKSKAGGQLLHRPNLLHRFCRSQPQVFIGQASPDAVGLDRLLVGAPTGSTGRSISTHSSNGCNYASIPKKSSLTVRGMASSVSMTEKPSSSSANADGSTAAPPSQVVNPMPDFNDAKAAYESKTTEELIRAALVFNLCRIPFLVKYSESMLRLSRRIVGDRFTDFILKQTMFGHFCAGEDEKRILPTIQKLEKAGIGSILDFAAEDDGGETMEEKKESAEVLVEEVLYDQVPRVRVYDYESEAQCDRHVETFKRCINSVKNLGPDGFAAVKVTALGNPKLLERMSRAIVETQNLFAKFDVGGDGIISRDEFEQGFNLFFTDDDRKLRTMLEMVNDATETTDVDYITWSMMLQPSDLPNITASCRDVGPLAMATPTDEEVELIEKMYQRGHELAQEAATCGTRLLIDAEQVRFQPAIDNLVLMLQRKHNRADKTDFPIIYNTYQCYLKDIPSRLPTDVERSERFNYHFGAKLVRGAYMESERELAERLGYPSPIHDTIEDTHNCYNSSVDYLLKHASISDKKTELMLASHNQQSIEKAIESMNKHGISRKDSTICFGQLLGMADNLSFNLGKHGYRAYKYVPYGEIKMVMPYLIRRANENSSLAGGAAQELAMIKNELKRRARI